MKHAAAGLWRPLRTPIFRHLFIAATVSDVGMFMHSVGVAFSRSRPAILRRRSFIAHGLQNLHPGSNPGGASNFIRSGFITSAAR